MPLTPMRSVRIPDDVWLEATAAARRAGVSVTHVIREALKAFARNERDAA